jgi:hypothetical protein
MLDVHDESDNRSNETSDKEYEVSMVSDLMNEWTAMLSQCRNKSFVGKLESYRDQRSTPAIYQDRTRSVFVDVRGRYSWVLHFDKRVGKACKEQHHAQVAYVRNRVEG